MLCEASSLHTVILSPPATNYTIAGGDRMAMRGGNPNLTPDPSPT
jgi:hypothetical protein